MKRTLSIAAFSAAFALVTLVAHPVAASEHKAPAKKEGGKEGEAKADEKKAGAAVNCKAPPKEGETAVGYGGTQVQLPGIMVPYRTARGVDYQLLQIRLNLTNDVEKQKPACWLAPILQEKLLMYLAKAKLTPADFQGQRAEVLVKNLMDVVVNATDRSYFSGLELVDESSPIMDCKSYTLSTQCLKSESVKEPKPAKPEGESKAHH